MLEPSDPHTSAAIPAPPRHAEAPAPAPLPDADGELAPGVRAGEVLKRLGSAVELVRGLDRHLQRTAFEQLRDAVEVLRRRLGHDHRATGALAGGAGRRRDARAVLEGGV